MTGNRIICESSALIDGKRAMRFEQIINDKIISCFAIRFDDTVHAYRNFCPHQGTELDWMPSEIFDESGLYLMCATHGAMFEPHSGKCVMGPCRGDSLLPITIEEKDGVVSTVATSLSAIPE